MTSSSSGSSTSQFNTGSWTDEEHQNFLRGVDVHGRGNWNAIGTLVRTRNPQQIEAHAGQHFAQSAEEQQDPEPAAEATVVTINSVVTAVGGAGTAVAPASELGSGMCYFGNGSVLYDWTGVL